MRVVALRGVCIGTDRHLLPGEQADIDPATAQYLAAIGAVERVADAPPADTAPHATPPAKPGKKEH